MLYFTMYFIWCFMLVRHQAEKLPNVKRVEMDVLNRQSKYMPEVHDILSCPVDCLPSDEWQRELLYSFSDLRQVSFISIRISSFKVLITLYQWYTQLYVCWNRIWKE